MQSSLSMEFIGVFPMSKSELVTLLEGRIKIELLQHFHRLGFIRSPDGRLLLPGNNKEVVRQLHSLQREERLLAQQKFVIQRWPELLNYFANGSEVNPTRISPSLELVKSGSWQADLFRLATLTWSVPVSQGFGRRMRFLVWDDYNGKLIGLIALGDPVFNLKARDDLIGWDSQERRERLVNVMDAYVLGALPPYSLLLGGKLIACLIRTREVVDIFSERYTNRCGHISKRKKGATLVMVTTTSALGRSSVYNRLKLGGCTYFESVGYTRGWGHFHIPDRLFALIREYLYLSGDPYASNYEFGQGPNWRLRAIRRCFNKLGMDEGILNHGISREIFACSVAANAIGYLTGRDREACYYDLLTVAEVSSLARQRWIIPRANRRPYYRQWRKEELLSSLLTEENHPLVAARGDVR